MEKAKWEKLIFQAATEANNGDSKNLLDLAQFCYEAYKAKEVLQNKGYGWLGLGLLEICQQIPQND